MTEGNILSHIIRFSIPLIFGNLFQLLYNTVDTWVVGNYVSNEAFSAVGTVSPIINMLIGVFLGLSNGAGVVISQHFGASNHERVSEAVHTAIVGTFILGIVFTVVGIIMTPGMLSLMGTPLESVPEATTYLNIYFSGVLGLMMYNMGTAILQAVGNSRLPFIFLVVCALVNTVLDLVFVICFHWGVAGVAYATIISEFISAVLVLIVLFRTKSIVRLNFHKLHISKSALKPILKIGFPSALQMGITSFSNVFVQSYINFFGTDVMSGWTVYNKMDQIMFLPMRSISLASSTFTGQNLGNKNTERAKKGINTALITAFSWTIILMVPLVVFAPAIVRFFNAKEEVIVSGTLFLRWLSPFYVACCVNQVLTGSLRGAGNTRAPMIIMLTSFVLVRQVYLFVMSNFISNTVLSIGLGYPFGWVVCSVSMYIYYKKIPLEKTVISN